MSVFNLGSINVDHFYQLSHIPAAGETVSASSLSTGLGGKGANQSVAVARAGSGVEHIGMVGPDGTAIRAQLKADGVGVAHVGVAMAATGHANVHVDPQGENMIVIFPGANREQSLTLLKSALAEAGPGDVLMLQNETDLTGEAARAAQEAGLYVVYSAAPFEPEAARAMLDRVDLLVLNEVEAEQLSEALGLPVDEIPVPGILITRGARGAVWRDQATGSETSVPAFPVTPVDTTGAGDCFVGYVVAGLDQGLERAAAMRLGAAASALQVTRHGTADAMPSRSEVDAFLDGIDPV